VFFSVGHDTHVTLPVSGTAPWVSRVAEIRANTAINIEAERKVAQLNDEMQGLIRTLKTKDLNIQESVVKIELMERRMEAVKKQADTIADLEGELSNSRKQKRVYEEAMEQLQADLDSLEQDNAKLKAMTSHERQSLCLRLNMVGYVYLRNMPASGNQHVEAESVQIEGSLETSYLLEQVRYTAFLLYLPLYSDLVDRCPPWYCSLPPNRKFVSERTRPFERIANIATPS